MVTRNLQDCALLPQIASWREKTILGLLRVEQGAWRKEGQDGGPNLSGCATLAHIQLFLATYLGVQEVVRYL